jgi:gas vesicle protein GvpG
MFLLDSLMISGIQWALETLVTTAEAEMNDDTALREQLLAAEMQREMGEITDDDFKDIERDLLERIRDIKDRRAGGSGPLEFGEGEPLDTSGDGRFQIEATVSGDFHRAADAPHTTVVETEPAHSSIVGARRGRTTSVLDVKPVHARTLEDSALPLPSTSRTKRTTPTKRTARTARTTRTVRTTPTVQASRTARTTSPRSKIRRS